MGFDSVSLTANLFCFGGKAEKQKNGAQFEKDYTQKRGFSQNPVNLYLSGYKDSIRLGFEDGKSGWLGYYGCWLSELTQ